MASLAMQEQEPVGETLVKRFDGVIRRPDYLFVKTTADADAAYETHMAGHPYGAHGLVVEKAEHRYFENAPAYYVHMYVLGDLHGPRSVMMHGVAFEHLLKRDDLDPKFRAELKSGLGFFAAHAPDSCWGPDKSPGLRAASAVAGQKVAPV